MNKKFLAKLLVLTAILGAAFLFPSLAGSEPKIAQAGPTTDIWWPTNGAKLSGSHPFKALLQNTDVNSYTMYWQVDNGQLNKMETNHSDYPHKEVTVDLSGWTWRGNDTYKITFLSKDNTGATISERSVNVYINNTNSGAAKPAASPTPKPAESVILTPSPTPTAPVVTKPAPSPSTPPTQNHDSPAPSAPQPISAATEVWWPANNVNITGSQPFKAVLKDIDLSKYKMYWQVDGGALSLMPDNYTDYPHKETVADINWNWKGQGPYTITFVAKDLTGKEISKKNVVIHNPNGVLPKNEAVVPQPSTPVVTEPTIPAVPQPSVPAVTNPTPTNPIVTAPTSDNPFAGSTFYVNPNSNAKRQADLWRNSRPADAAMMDKIAANPDAKWVGNWNSNIQADVKAYVDEATSKGGMPVLIAYNIPGRDCGHYSAGGAANAENYKTWIRGLADGIGNRKAAVILEPDALAGITCLDSQGQASRNALIKDAISVLKAKGNVAVYVDAGHSNWIGVDEMAARLKNAGIENAHGFALNVSNYNVTSDQITYGTKLSGLLGGKHFVVDTSRNGQGPLGSEWCNPAGRGLGIRATTNTGNPLVDAYMWLKNPGESDGTCNGGPSAGVWWPEYALGLAQKAAF